MNGSSIEMKNNSTIKGFYYAINVTALMIIFRFQL